MNILKERLNNLNVVITTHIFATGPPQELEDYLKHKVNTLMFIGHPFSYAKDVRSFYRIHRHGKLEKEKRAGTYRLPELFMYLKDFIYTFAWIINLRKKIDIYIGVDPLNAFVGILLKKLKKVNKVILYTIDYVPQRFDCKLLNSLYHWLDSYCVRHSDLVWNLSGRMIKARMRKGIPNSSKQIVVPVGVHFDRIKQLPIEKINRKHIVYVGHLRKGQGLELVIEALPEVIKKIPDARLIIIGTGYLEYKLKKKVEELKIADYVEFRGFIEDHKEVENILSKCAVGLAIYEPSPNSFTWYADPSKPKQYMACGLPVIITKVSWIAEEIEKRPMGIVINYNKYELINAIIKLLIDQSFYEICRKNAIQFASRLDWRVIFDNAFANLR